MLICIKYFVWLELLVQILTSTSICLLHPPFFLSLVSKVSPAHLTQRTQADRDIHLSLLFIHAPAYMLFTLSISAQTSGKCISVTKVVRMDQSL